MSFKIATWNVNSLRVRLPHVLQWLLEHKPDVLALQETKLLDVDFPVEAIQQAGYRVSFVGQKTYNGMALISREPCQDLFTAFPTLDDPQRRILGATIQGIRILDLYVPNGEHVDSDKYRYKLDWLHHLAQCLKEELKTFPKMIILGDFNIAPEPEDVHDPAAWEGSVLFSPKERAALREIFELGFADSFRLFPQPEKSYSWWDYRMNAFKRKRGLRIDHILVSKALVNQCVSCSIDTAPRAWERPSDHAPVMAEFTLT